MIFNRLKPSLLAMAGAMFLIWRSFTPAVAQCGEWTEPAVLFSAENQGLVEPPTTKPENALGLRLSPEVFAELHADYPEKFQLPMTFPGGDHHMLDLEAMRFVTEDFEVGLMGDEGSKKADYEIGIKPYRVRTEGCSGSIILMRDYVIGTLRIDGITYEIGRSRGSGHVVFLLSDSKAENSFSCGTTEAHHRGWGRPQHGITERTANMPPACVEVALDIDNHTYGTFGNSCNNSVDTTWIM